MANVVYTFDVDDTSPAVQYSPFGDTFTSPDLLRGWNPYFTESGFARFQGDRGNGTSLHISALNGSTVSLQWRGTGIEILGNTTRATYAVTLDGETQTATPNNQSLAKFSNLSDSNHSITLTTLTSDPNTPDSFIAFDKFVVTSIPINDITNASLSTDTLPENSVAFSGAWTFINSNDPGSAHRSTRIGDRIVAKFLGTAFSLLGTTSPAAGTFSVSVDGTPSTVSARSSFEQSDALLYFVSGLDLNATHTVQIINGEGELTVLSGGFVVHSNGSVVPPETTPIPSPSPTPPLSTSFPKGTIAALVLAGILAFILITALFMYIFAIRPRQRRRHRPTFPPPLPSKELEAAEDVLDIGPNGPRGEHSAGLAGFVERHDSRVIERRWERERERRGSGGSKSKRASGRSAKSGFARWKEEMENGFGGRGLGGLGLIFRQSLGAGTVRSTDNDHGRTTDDEKSPTSPTSPEQDKGEAGSNGEPVVAGSSSSDNMGISVVSRMFPAKKVKSKKKRSATSIRQTGDSPSFTIDLPLPTLPTLPRNSGSPHNHSPQISQSRSSGSMPQSTLLPIPGQQRSSTHSQSISGQSGSANDSNRAPHERTSNQSDSSPALSYISSPVYPSNDQPAIPTTLPVVASQPTPAVLNPNITVSAATSSHRPLSTQPRPLPKIQSLPDVPLSSSRPGSRDKTRPTSIRPLPVPTASPSSQQLGSHQRSQSGSSAVLLRSGEPNVDVPDDDEYRPTVYRATESTPFSGRIVEESSRSLLLPPQESSSKGDRGSVSSSYVTDMDGIVKAETMTGQIAVRGLRPRISEARMPTGRSTPSLTLDTNILPLPRTTSRGVEAPRPALPEVEKLSPFNVDFTGALGSGSKDEHGHIRFGGGAKHRSGPGLTAQTSPIPAASPSKPKKIRALPRIPSLRQKSTFRLTPPSGGVPPHGSPDRSDSEGVLSFLDFSSGSTEGSIFTQSNDSSSHRMSKSRWSGPSLITSLHRRPSTNPPPPDEPVASGSNHDPMQESEPKARPQRHSHSESSGKTSNSSGGFPFPVSLPPSPHHPAGTYASTSQLAPPLPQRSAIPTVNVIDSSSHESVEPPEPVRPRHPSGLPGPEAVSPTDSIPISVSDIHFRHSESDSTGESISRRASSGSHLPPHPPLPGAASSMPSTPSPADLAVQRLFGLTPPQSATSQSHRRQGSDNILRK